MVYIQKFKILQFLSFTALYFWFYKANFSELINFYHPLKLSGNKYFLVIYGAPGDIREFRT